MRRTSNRLSDGREIIYFDHDASPERTAVDERGLTEKAQIGELRFDAFTGEWIAIASHRQTRTHLPSASECPLCATVNGRLSEIPESSYDVAVFENRFPSLRSPDGENWKRPRPGWGANGPSAGRCEVVCFSQDHQGSFKDLSPAHARLVVEAWADRTAALSELPYIRQVFPFENRGEEIGVTLHHPHGQIYGYSYLPPRMARLLEQARAYRDETGGHLIADVVRKELADGSRVIFAGEHWVAFVPYAARWPFEAQLHPRRAIHDFSECNDAERAELAVVYPRLLRSLDNILGVTMPYVAAWFQAPFNGPDDERTGITLHLQLQSTRRAVNKLKFPAGSEMAMGAFIGDVPPEASADQWRAAYEAEAAR